MSVQFFKRAAAFAVVGGFLCLSFNPSVAHATGVNRAVFNYLTHCGGCHGIEGQSGDSGIPSLRDHVDVFLCSKEGRAYLGQVPGVSMSLIRSDQELADVLNFMVFQFGGKSLQPNTKPYTAAEVHALRQNPVKVDDIMTYRAEILGRALPACQHPKTP